MVETRHQRRLREQKERNAASSKKVFDVAELLEHILLYLDTKTALIAQCVDRTLKATIDGSIRLQRMLWFSPDTSEDENLEISPLSLNVYRYLRCHMWTYSGYIDVICHLDELPKPSGSFNRMHLLRVPEDEAENIEPLECRLEFVAPKESNLTRGFVVAPTELDHTMTLGQLGEHVRQKAREKWPGRFDDEGNLLPKREGEVKRAGRKGKRRRL